MSAWIDKAVARLSEKLPDGFPEVAKFVIEEEGTILVDRDGVRTGDAPAALVLSADTVTFRGMFEGRVNPMTAFMTGRLRIEGPMPLAMKLGKAMSGGR